MNNEKIGMTSTRKVSEVTTLSRYGKHITGITPKVHKRMPGMVLRAVIEKFGLMRGIVFLLSAQRRGRQIIKEHPDASRLALKYSPDAARDFSLLGGMFAILSAWENEDSAYAFLKKIIQQSAPDQMAELYQVEELKQFEDRFEAFKQFNRAMFTNDENYRMQEFVDHGNDFHIHLSSCANCTIAQAFGYPRLAQLGCDHDLVGYPGIEEDVDAVFRRPQTLAKGGQMCEFIFYRKGFEPEGPYENK